MIFMVSIRCSARNNAMVKSTMSSVSIMPMLWPILIILRCKLKVIEMLFGFLSINSA
jgi:hypothetical protein